MFRACTGAARPSKNSFRRSGRGAASPAAGGTVPSLTRRQIASDRARISRTWTGLGSTSSMPESNRFRVCSRERWSASAMIGARECWRISPAQRARVSKSPSRKPCTASRSSAEALVSQLVNSSGENPKAETPSRSKLAAYPAFTASLSSTKKYIPTTPFGSRRKYSDLL